MLFQVQNSILDKSCTPIVPNCQILVICQKFEFYLCHQIHSNSRKCEKSEREGHKYCFSIMMATLCNCKHKEPFLILLVDFFSGHFFFCLKGRIQIFFFLKKHSSNLCEQERIWVIFPKRWKTLNRRDSYCYTKGSIIF